MTIHFQQLYHAGQFVLQFIGVGTVVKAIPGASRWVRQRLRNGLQDRVLATFYHMDNGPWQSAHGIVGEMYIKAALSDARGFFPPKVTGPRAAWHWLRTLPYWLRHTYRLAFVLPRLETIEKVLRNLWKQGLLIRAGWTHTRTEYYRLRD